MHVVLLFCGFPFRGIKRSHLTGAPGSRQNMSTIGSQLPTPDEISIGSVKRPVLSPVGGLAPPTSSSLVMAARHGDMEAMKLLLAEAETNPLFCINAADRFGRSLLWYGVTNGHLDATRLLLEKGANVNCRDLVGWMPLHISCYNGMEDITRLLLERKAEVDAKTYAGQTPRWLAHSNARPGAGIPSEAHTQIASLLEERGGTLGLPPQDWVNPRQPRRKRSIPPDEIRCCHEDGQRYNIDQLIKAYVYEKEMYTEEECEDYFRKEMQIPPENHAAWILKPIAPLEPGEGKYG